MPTTCSRRSPSHSADGWGRRAVAWPAARRSLLLRVRLVEEVRDLVGVALLHDPQLHLQRRRELALLLGQQPREERDTARALVVGEVVEQPPHLALDELHHRTLGDQL